MEVGSEAGGAVEAAISISRPLRGADFKEFLRDDAVFMLKVVKIGGFNEALVNRVCWRLFETNTIFIEALLYFQ